MKSAHSIFPTAPRCLLTLWTLAAWLSPSAAQANPVMFNAGSFAGFCVPVFFAMVAEAGAVALVLSWRGVAALPLFFAYLILNGAVFLCLFQPLLWSGSAPVPALEAMVVLVDASIIKVLAARASFQGVRFRGAGWLSALSASGVGNGLSYLIGYLTTRELWRSELNG